MSRIESQTPIACMPESPAPATEAEAELVSQDVVDSDSPTLYCEMSEETEDFSSQVQPAEGQPVWALSILAPEADAAEAVPALMKDVLTNPNSDVETFGSAGDLDYDLDSAGLGRYSIGELGEILSQPTFDAEVGEALASRGDLNSDQVAEGTTVFREALENKFVGGVENEIANDSRRVLGDAQKEAYQRSESAKSAGEIAKFITPSNPERLNKSLVEYGVAPDTAETLTEKMSGWNSTEIERFAAGEDVDGAGSLVREGLRETSDTLGEYMDRGRNGQLDDAILTDPLFETSRKRVFAKYSNPIEKGLINTAVANQKSEETFSNIGKKAVGFVADLAPGRFGGTVYGLPDYIQARESAKMGRSVAEYGYVSEGTVKALDQAESKALGDMAFGLISP